MRKRWKSGRMRNRYGRMYENGQDRMQWPNAECLRIRNATVHWMLCTLQLIRVGEWIMRSNNLKWDVEGG